MHVYHANHLEMASLAVQLYKRTLPMEIPLKFLVHLNFRDIHAIVFPQFPFFEVKAFNLFAKRELSPVLENINVLNVEAFLTTSGKTIIAKQNC